MKTYRVKLTINSGIQTMFQSDTIFGHLCWVVKYMEGDENLKKFLTPFINGEPPFLISNGFPEDLLPKPLSVDIYATLDKRKDIKKTEFVDFNAFNNIRKCIECDLKSVQPISYQTIPHNTINRQTGTTLAEGGLFSLEEYYVPNISIYLKVKSETWKDKIANLLRELSNSGYGSKKSIGKGQFRIESIEAFDKFEDIKKADGFVTLSNFCPGQDDPTEGLYKTFIKYGKLGEEFTYCGNPFKKPLLMIKAGSVFKINNAPKDFYGKMVSGISPVKPEVMQYAYAFPIPLVYPKL